jgi:hypothetical protein
MASAMGGTLRVLIGARQKKPPIARRLLGGSVPLRVPPTAKISMTLPPCESAACTYVIDARHAGRWPCFSKRTGAHLSFKSAVGFCARLVR